MLKKDADGEDSVIGVTSKDMPVPTKNYQFAQSYILSYPEGKNSAVGANGLLVQKDSNKDVTQISGIVDKQVLSDLGVILKFINENNFLSGYHDKFVSVNSSGDLEEEEVQQQ